jgi:hypothetical protein
MPLGLVIPTFIMFGDFRSPFVIILVGTGLIIVPVLGALVYFSCSALRDSMRNINMRYVKKRWESGETRTCWAWAMKGKPGNEARSPAPGQDNAITTAARPKRQAAKSNRTLITMTLMVMV